MQEWLARASAARQAGRAAEAATAYEAALAIQPANPNAWYNLGLMRRRLGQFEAGLEAYAEALQRGISDPEEVHLNRAVILIDDLDRPEDAQRELAAALHLNPAYVPALLNLGNLHEDRGAREEARATYAHLLALVPDMPLALARLANATRFSSRTDPLIVQLEQALTRPVAQDDRAELAFALGRALDSVRDYDAAFQAFSAANAASRQASGARYDRKSAEALIGRLIATFPRKSASSASNRVSPSVFICGHFRSGSTLLERILVGHSGLRSGGELDVLPSLIVGHLQPWPEAAARLSPDATARLAQLYVDQVNARRPGAGLAIDKRPDNFLAIGLIKTLFPSARILHTIRDARDVALSNWMLHLSPSMAYALDLEDLAHWHGCYRRLMDHWKALWPSDILDVDYDRLVREPEAAIKDVTTFLGLAWEPDVLDFSARQGAVRTASVWQVREPLYSTSSGRWRNYAGWLPERWPATLDVPDQIEN
ncbi:tetratricopeptide repeat-containing sulfotransferase family protein [Brevundimonas aveniformis]|uniref:tetratricopeptide repeat-containing sulfotransferase family protein n=1 Tax=Brevundimonas aveniformis TaxID=370977 RepID=UPI0003F4E440|nr:sulfotransferase [Brevundimonas aveniformis]